MNQDPHPSPRSSSTLAVWQPRAITASSMWPDGLMVQEEPTKTTSTDLSAESLSGERQCQGRPKSKKQNVIF